MVRQVRWEADGVVTVDLSDPNNAELPPFKPGEHIEVNLPTGIVRQYSLCGSLDDRTMYRIGVLREHRSRGGSEYIHSFLRPGQRIRVRGPINNFDFHPSSEYIFIAGGIGITPILPMIEAADATGSTWKLGYAGRSANSMAFSDHIGGYGDRVFFYPRDKLVRIPLAEWLGNPQEGVDVYACGPESLLSAVENHMSKWRPEALHLERFRALEVPPKPNYEIDVICTRSERLVTVRCDQSILAALEDAGVPVSGSCKEGLCGTCETKVVDGIPDHRDSILTGQDRSINDRMFICVSRSRGATLTLDV